MSACSFRVTNGYIVTFRYYGGEDAGQKRTVLITNNTPSSTTVTAWCFTRKAMRTFSKDKIKEVEYANDDATRVNLLSLPTFLQDGKILQEGFEKEGKSCYIDNDNIMIAVTPPKSIKSTTSVYKDGYYSYYINVVGKNGLTGSVLVCGQTNADLIKQLTAFEC